MGRNLSILRFANLYRPVHYEYLRVLKKCHTFLKGSILCTGVTEKRRETLCLRLPLVNLLAVGVFDMVQQCNRLFHIEFLLDAAVHITRPSFGTTPRPVNTHATTLVAHVQELVQAAVHTLELSRAMALAISKSTFKSLPVAVVVASTAIHRVIAP